MKQSEDEGLREQLREYIGIVKFGPKYWDYITTPPTIPRGKYPSERAIEELDNITNYLIALISQKIIEAKTDMLNDSDLMQVGAIPQTDEYANGWNDCRKAYYQRRQDIIATLTQGIKE